MKRIMILLIFLLGSGGLFAQKSKIIVEADKSLNAEFSKYKTYQFAPQVLDASNSLFFVNDLILKENIIHAVEHELRSRGYEFTAAKPDMVINFRVFEKPTQLTGFVDAQTNFGGERIRVEDNKKTYDVQAGTLMLSIADTKSGQLLWQGFASGIMDNNVFDKKKERIEEAVGLLFDQFKQRADNLSRK